MAMTCPNSGFIGYPVLLLALPSVAGVVLGLNMLVENLVTIPLVLALAERGAGSRGSWLQQVRETAGRLIRNPMVVGILLGLLVSIFGVSLPAVLTRAVDLFPGPRPRWPCSRSAGCWSGFRCAEWHGSCPR